MVPKNQNPSFSFLDWVDGSNHEIKSNTIYLQLASDGVQYAKTGKQLWPIMIQILNLRIEERTKRYEIFLPQVDFEKPSSFDEYLENIQKEIKRLVNGFNIWNCFTKETELWKVNYVNFSCDNDARHMLLGYSPCTGYYGCGFCDEKGTYVTGCVRFLHNGNTRNKSMVEKGSFGVKGISVIQELKVADWWQSFPPDFMHTGLLRIGGMFLCDINTSELNTLSKIKYPPFVSWKPRSDVPPKKWKAEAIKVFAMISPAIAREERWSSRYTGLWDSFSNLVFVSTKRRFVEEKIENLVEEIKQCSEELKRNHDTVYGADKTIYSMHVVNHMAEYVQNQGPLYSYWMFPYENFVGSLRAGMHGSSEKDIIFSSLSWLFRCLCPEVENDGGSIFQAYDEFHLDMDCTDVNGNPVSCLKRKNIHNITVVREELGRMWSMPPEVFKVSEIWKEIMHQGKIFKTNNFYLLKSDEDYFCVNPSLFCKSRAEGEDYYAYVGGSLWELEQISRCVFRAHSVGFRVVEVSRLAGECSFLSGKKNWVIHMN